VSASITAFSSAAPHSCGFLVLVGPTFAWVQMVVSRWLSSGPLSDGPVGWLLPFAIGAVLGTLIVFPFFILIHWAIKPVLSPYAILGRSPLAVF
jgi:hypothetical protein